MNKNSEKQSEAESVVSRRKWHFPLEVYDLALLLIVNILLLGFYPSAGVAFGVIPFVTHLALSSVCVWASRTIGGVYRQIWRYGSPVAYIRLIISDFAAGFLYFGLQAVLPIAKVSFLRAFSIISFSLLLSVSIRLLYQFFYEYAKKPDRKHSKFLRGLMGFISGLSFNDSVVGVDTDGGQALTKIRIAIVGAGQVGVMLAEELRKNPRAEYTPCCFIDKDRSKIGREIFGLPIFSGDEDIAKVLAETGVQEVVFALPRVEPEKIKELYEFYKKTGCKIKVYDYPVMQTTNNGKRHMRQFDIEELLFRKPVQVYDEQTSAYYKDKVVLITGGGGSIGGELCRQIARMQPEKLVILDVCENGAYDIQQELRIAYGAKLTVCVEIVSVCDRYGVEKVFAAHKPHVVLHAAAHKHVPLMEHNCCEAVKNNVFGTLNVVELAEKYGVQRFMMVSTDKAVNPTNVMGATKRMCEMIVQSHSRSDTVTTFSATRFGNVLGSAASVVPLFKKQIMNGGPVTITDKRIIRYFMTIPEASQLVLQSGAMARNGELFVLDMGKPIHILELAETMIRLGGFEPYRDIDIVETGLRPGEKLYEELLIRTEELDKTQNSMIFIERDTPLSLEVLGEKLDVLRSALDTGDDAAVKAALISVVPTYRTPDEVNSRETLESTMKSLSYDAVTVATV